MNTVAIPNIGVNIWNQKSDILEHYNDCIIIEIFYKKHSKLILTTFTHLLLQ